ncbi:MAG: bifunctional [glutamate--ammonia ligase]-adenylyl-L-tyrosine phosphorylase/[glutamate--ammonia-ligase] adenylyltransferase, partial [Burkholderiales bacterium]
MPAADTGPGAAAGAIERACRLSRYARRTAASQPALLQMLDATRAFTAQAMRNFIRAAEPSDETALMAALRELRKRVLLTLIVRDLAGWADLSEVTSTMTALADTALDEACTRIEAWAATQYGSPTAPDGSTQHLMVVGMGKLGGCELNVSSDIDLVFLHGDEGETRGARSISNSELFTRIARKLIAALGEITAEGFVFRVDMRLRPYGDSGPLVCNLAMLESYFITQGREWERYA